MHAIIQYIQPNSFYSQTIKNIKEKEQEEGERLMRTRTVGKVVDEDGNWRQLLAVQDVVDANIK